MTDYFAVFGLPRKLRIDVAALQQKFYDLQKRYHPDFQGRATPEEQAQALQASARLNAAYRALRDPVARAEYLVRLEEGRETKEGAVVKPQAPPELLAEMFEIQEALAEARAGGLDDATRATLAGQREHLAARQRDEEARITGPLAAEWDAADAAARAGVLGRVKAALAARAYLRTVIDDLGQALGGGEGEHVAHHRH